MGYEFTNKWALVTGAGRKGRVGAKIAERLAAEGTNIYLQHRVGGESEAEAVARDVEAAGAKFNVQVVLIPADLTREEDIIKSLNAMDPAPQIVINNAAVFEPAHTPAGADVATVVRSESETFEKNIGINLKSVLVTTQAAIAKLKLAGKKGTFVFIGDAFLAAGGTYGNNLAAYAASKIALEAMMRELVREHGAAGFKFLLILNGPIEPPPGAPAETVDAISSQIPAPRNELAGHGWVGTDKVANAVVSGINETVDAGTNGDVKRVDMGRGVGALPPKEH